MVRPSFRARGRRTVAPPRHTLPAGPHGRPQATAREAQTGAAVTRWRKSAGRTGVSRTVREREVVVIGAGQAGLATAWALARQGFDRRTGFVVLDADAAPGGAWQHRWRSLTVATTHRVHELPGMPFTPTRDDAPAADEVPAYFAAYERRFDLPVRRPVAVSAVHRTADGFRLTTSDGDWTARAVVSATGTWTRPFVPHHPGQETFAGRQLHTAGYRGAAEFAGRHVVVVGGGASAVQLLGEISAVTSTTWVTRRPPVWREGPFRPEDGRAAVAMVEAAVRAGRVPGSVVGVTGLVVTPWVREARERGVLDRLPVFDRITPDGVAWDDGRSVRADVILWATGFRAAVGHLAPLHVREPSGVIRLDGTAALREPLLHLVGYGPSASTIGANRAGRAAARALRRRLSGTDAAAA
jgi:cation diffusion facilitator CzcD-associated flavoprotein CzcO